MATLHGPGGTALGLTINGYQYPKITSGDDANWLDVRVDVHHPRGNWSFTPAWMTTVDARKLTRWFDGVAAGRAVDNWSTDELLFMLAFMQARQPSISLVVTRGALPPWRGADDGEELAITLGLDMANIRAFADDWKRQLESYPVWGDCK